MYPRPCLDIVSNARVQVVLFGECHDDPVAHSLEAFLLVSLAAQREATALSLEMFEADVQLVLDEYLAGRIAERDLLQDARCVRRYQSDADGTARALVLKALLVMAR